MEGPEGGGFLFDTNAIHRGVVEGTKERTVVILEFNNQDKVAALSKLRHPCPSKGLFRGAEALVRSTLDKRR